MADRPPLPDLTRENPFVQFLLRFADLICPEGSSDWLEDMRFELPFVPREERLEWAWGAVWLALQLRLGERLLRSPAALAFGSFALTAAVLTVVVLPNRSLPAPAVRQEAPALPADERAAASPVVAQESTLPEAEDADSAAADPAAGAAAQANNRLAEPPAPGGEGATELLDFANDSAPPPVPSLPAAGQVAASENSAETPEPAAAPAVNTGSVAELSALPAESPTAPAPQDAAQDSTANTALVLYASEASYIEMYSGNTRTAANTLFKGTLEPGEELTLSPPLLLYTTNAGGLEFMQNGERVQLGEPGEELERAFP